MSDRHVDKERGIGRRQQKRVRDGQGQEETDIKGQGWTEVERN